MNLKREAGTGVYIKQPVIFVNTECRDGRLLKSCPNMQKKDSPLMK